MENKRKWEVTYKGAGFSLNDFYSQGHYSKRQGIKDSFAKKFRALIDKEKVEEIEQYRLTCEYNSRHDPSNISGMVKVFEDTLAGNPNKKKGTRKFPPLIIDDNKFYCKGITIIPNLDFKLNTFKFIIEEL